MKRVLALLFCFLLTTASGYCQYSPNGPNGPIGLPSAQITSLSMSVPATATTVNLVAPSTQITIINAEGSANLHISFSGTATLSNGYLPGGVAFIFTNLQNVSSFSVIGDSATGSFSVIAHSSPSDSMGW